MRKRKLEAGPQGQGESTTYFGPFLCLSTIFPHSRSNRCGERSWAVVLARDIQSERGLQPDGSARRGGEQPVSPETTAHPGPGRDRVRPGCQTPAGSPKQETAGGAEGEGPSPREQEGVGMPVLKTRVWEGLLPTCQEP